MTMNNEDGNISKTQASINKIVEKFFIAKDENKKKLEDYEIEQGDILIEFPKDFLGIKVGKPSALVIGTYTCDIPKKDTRRIQLLPIYPLRILKTLLFKRFVETKTSKEYRNNLEPGYLNKLKESFKKLGKKDKDKFIIHIRNIFQFKDRNYFLLCPHRELKGLWCYIDVQSIQTIKKSKDSLNEIKKYTKLTISSPWREKFGSVLSDRFGKVAVEHFTNNQIKSLFLTI